MRSQLFVFYPGDGMSDEDSIHSEDDVLQYLQASDSSNSDTDSDNLMISQELKPGFSSSHSSSGLAEVLEAEEEPDTATIDRDLDNGLSSLNASASE